MREYKPNLQQIPIRTPEGRRIREAVAEEVKVSLAELDFAELELRVMSMMAEEDPEKAWKYYWKD